MDYRAFYDLVIEEKDYLQAFDVTQDQIQMMQQPPTAGGENFPAS